MRKILSILILSGFLCFNFEGIAIAVTAKSIQAQMDTINAQIEALDKEIIQYQNQIIKTSSQANTLSKIIKELNLTKSKLLKEKDQIQKKIIATNITIRELGNNISSQEESIEISKMSISKMIYDLYQRDSESTLQKLLSKNTISEATKEYNNIITVNNDIKSKIIDLTIAKESLQNTKIEKEKENKNLNDLKTTLLQKAKVVESTQKEKDTLLKETKNKEAEYQKLLAQRIATRDAFEKQLSAYEDQLQYILNPNSIPKTGSEPLAWPLKSVFITQLFGYTSSSGRLYRSGTHSGVDFRASTGTPVYAMANGKVVGFGDTDIYCKGASFGKWILIKYDNGLASTYGHLSSISVKKEQKVKTGDIVGLSGNTGHTTGPHLHVTVYPSDGVEVKSVPSLSCNGKNFIMPIAASTAYLDPMLYLPKTTISMIKK